jgi:hypothetical protein
MVFISIITSQDFKKHASPLQRLAASIRCWQSHLALGFEAGRARLRKKTRPPGRASGIARNWREAGRRKPPPGSGLSLAPSASVSDFAVVERAHLQDLVSALQARGYRVLGPTVCDRAIVYAELGSADDLPAGWTDAQ